MDATQQARLRWPWLTISMVGSAVLIAVWPGLDAWLVYDRAAILHGEVWRMFTGHWVHFSTSHLIYDSLALGVCGFILEQRSKQRFILFCATAPWFISLALLVSEPEMIVYGGLSGLATGATVLMCVEGLRHPSWRWVSMAGLLALTIKTVFAGVSFATFGEGGIEVATTSHIVGALVALGVIASCGSLASSGSNGRAATGMTAR